MHSLRVETGDAGLEQTDNWDCRPATSQTRRRPFGGRDRARILARLLVEAAPRARATCDVGSRRRSHTRRAPI